MCAMAVAMACLSLPAMASGTLKRHRHFRGQVAQKRRVLRRWRCSGANLVPDAGNLAATEQATLCLVNRERTSHHLPALAANASLAAVATAHSAEMVNRDYFSHRSPSGATPQMRIVTSGYVPPSSRVAVGENVATAGGDLDSREGGERLDELTPAPREHPRPRIPRERRRHRARPAAA